MSECCDAKLLQVLFRQARKNRLVYLILAECSLILPEAEAPQPDHNVHDETRVSVTQHIICERQGEGLRRRRVWKEWRKRRQPLRARKAVVGAKVAMVPSELLGNAAVAEGITSIATVHDIFGCLPADAERFRRIIREQFVQMYAKNDVLAQVLEYARNDLKDPKGLPAKPPEQGSLKIEQVLDAEYAFA